MRNSASELLFECSLRFLYPRIAVSDESNARMLIIMDSVNEIELCFTSFLRRKRQKKEAPG